MVNTSKIRGRMRQLGISDYEAALTVHLSVPLMRKKLNNICPLTLQEAEMLADLLQISDHVFCDYFFA